MEVTCFFDYTCGYSYKIMLLLERVRKERPELAVEWSTFALKEVNRHESAPSLFEGPGITSISIMALALGHAARAADFDTYHRNVFDTMHGQGRRVGKNDLLKLASAAGVDTKSFERNEDRWLASVAEEHRAAVARWEVFGTPTAVLDGSAAVYLKLSKLPETDKDAADLWQALWTISVSYPELVEIKRPR